MAVTATVVFPGTGTESAILVTMTAGDEMVCTGTAGAPATCIHVSVETADVPRGGGPSDHRDVLGCAHAGFHHREQRRAGSGPYCFYVGRGGPLCRSGVMLCGAIENPSEFKFTSENYYNIPDGEYW